MHFLRIVKSTILLAVTLHGIPQHAYAAALPSEAQGIYNKITCNAVVEQTFYTDKGYQNALKYWLFTKGETEGARIHSMAQPFLRSILQGFYNHVQPNQNPEMKETVRDIFRTLAQSNLNLTLKDIVRYRKEIAWLDGAKTEGVMAFGFIPITIPQANHLSGLLPWDLIKAEKWTSGEFGRPDIGAQISQYFLSQHWYRLTRSTLRYDLSRQLLDRLYFDYNHKYVGIGLEPQFLGYLEEIAQTENEHRVYLRLKDGDDLGIPETARLTVEDFRAYVRAFFGIYSAAQQTLP